MCLACPVTVSKLLSLDILFSFHQKAEDTLVELLEMKTCFEKVLLRLFRQVLLGLHPNVGEHSLRSGRKFSWHI